MPWGLGLRSRRWINGLLVGEMALSVILLASAALLIRSALMVYQADRVIDASMLLTARISLPPSTYGTPEQRLMFYDQLEARLASTPSAALARLLREEVRMLDADVSVHHISTLERLSQQSRWIPRVASSLLTLFAAIATLLSAMGLYAVTSYSLSQRTSEIRIRMALGAERRQIAWLFLRGTLGHIVLGLALGIGGAMAVAQLLRGMLVQTSALDPLTFAGVVVLLGTVAVVACLLPAWRASALDPAVALRHD